MDHIIRAWEDMSCHIGDLETHIGFLKDHTREVFERLEGYHFDRDQVIEVWGDLRLLKIRDWKWHFLVNFLEMESIGTLGKKMAAIEIDIHA